MSSSTASELAALPGLDSAKKVVLGLAAGSPVQSVLFYGIEGCGADELASVLTRAWLCTASGPEGACGTCQACRAYERGRAVDVLVLVPKGKSRILRLSAITPTSDPKELEDYPVCAQTFLRTAPLAARRKVVVIKDADRLNSRAANSLLKILEEPPEYGRFLLLTESVGALLPTILSRCLSVACEVPQRLEGFEEWAVRIAGGAAGRARQIQDKAAVYRPLYDFATGLGRRPSGDALVAADEFLMLASKLQASLKVGARAANSEALRVLATVYASTPGTQVEPIRAMIEAHRRIVGNAAPSGAMDALFATILSDRGTVREA